MKPINKNNGNSILNLIYVYHITDTNFGNGPKQNNRKTSYEQYVIVSAV